jgi:hypothetical protein
VADVGVLLGDGQGNFTPIDPLIGLGSVPSGSISIALQDVNNDTFLDVIVADEVSVKVQLGNGDGTLQQFTSFKAGYLRPVSVAVADLNGDGNPDIAVADECTALIKSLCTNPGHVAGLAGKGDGTFQAPVTYTSGGKLATSVAVADANLDTRPDIFVSNACISATGCSANGIVGVLLNVFRAAVTITVTADTNPSLVNHPVNFTATVTSGVPIIDGSEVDFFDGVNPIGSGNTTKRSRDLDEHILRQVRGPYHQSNHRCRHLA